MANAPWDPSTLAALGPLLTLLAPYARSVSRRQRILSSVHFCDLLARRGEALKQLEDPETEKWPGLRDRLRRLVRDIDRELTAMEWRDDSFRLFIAVAATEVTLFSGLVFAGVWRLRIYLFAGARKTGVAFFEGIFASAGPRVALFMIVVGIAAALTRLAAPRLESLVEGRLKRVAAHFVVFNSLLVLVAGLVFQVLDLTHELSPYW